MANHILFVFEGQKTEKQIFESLQKYYLNETESTILISAYCSEIYSLYHIMKRDTDLDLFSLIKEKEPNKESLSGISRETISEIYLFFDYDGHAAGAKDFKLKEMLHLFNEETENGKLYVSYPMVESLKHLKENIVFSSTIVDAKNNIKYKGLVHNNSDACYKNFVLLSQQNWNTIIEEHCKKLNFIMTNKFELPDDLTSQIEVFEMQLEKYIIPTSQVSVLSAFPVFIADYYGYSHLSKLLKRK